MGHSLHLDPFRTIPEGFQTMPYYTVQCITPTVDNVAANYATNTFHMYADDLTALDDAFDALVLFYKDLGGYFSSLVRQNNWEIKAYDDDDPEPRAPVLSRLWNQTSAPAGTPLPPEVALCLSFQGDQVSGVPQARKRGRVYLPYFETVTAGTDGRPASAACTTIASAGEDLMDAGTTSGTWHWVTFSSVAPGYSTVTNGWCDNEWDTQRRRGRPYTTRNVFP